jgi:hypothetical protein
MFSAWNFYAWIASAAAALMMLGIVVAVSALLAYTTIAVLGKEKKMAKRGVGKAEVEKEAAARKVA